MTSPKGVFWGVVVILVSMLVISTTAAGVFYGEYQSEASQSKTYAGELGTALQSYRALQNSYNDSLAGYNKTITLLTLAVANLNTSTPAYQEASVALSSLWARYQQLTSASGQSTPAYVAHMLLDFGNGTRVWYNDTAVQPGWNGYVTTLVLLNGDVRASWYPQYGEHFVTGIDGVSDTPTAYWFLLTYNATASWQVAQVGADALPVNNGTTFAWAFCAENSDFLPTCPLP